MIILQINDVSRKFADETLYENVTFHIQDRERIALVGRNGTGKSTLIKQIMGEEPLSSGTISKVKGLNIGYMAQHVALDFDESATVWQVMLSAFDDTLALREQVQRAAERLSELADRVESVEYERILQEYDRLNERLTELNAYAIEADIRTVLHGFRFYESDYDTPIQQLSGGQRTRLGLARILLMRYDLLILDEPTNHLDMATLAWLEQYLTSYRGALLVVSHDRYFLDKVATRVIELRHQTLHQYVGNYSAYMTEKALRLEQEWKMYQQQQNKIQQLEDFVQRNIARASTTKRAQSRRKQLEKMTRIAKPKQDQQSPRIQFSIARESGERVIDLQNGAIGYADSNEKIAENIRLDLRKQEAIALVGPNGIGKTTLLKTLMEKLPLIAGELKIGTGVDFGYYDQELQLPNSQETVLETLWQAHDTTDEKVIRSILGSFLFSGSDVMKTVSMLSGGEKARLSLALLATNHDNTLLLDEPTNHLDIDSKEVLEEALIEFDGTLLFVSHDRYFINRIATQVVELTSTGTNVYLGDYDYYLEKKAILEAEQASVSTTVASPIVKVQGTAELDYEASKQLKREIRKLTQVIEKAEQTLQILEEEIETLHQEMTIASQQNDQATLHQLHVSLQEKEQQQMEWLEQWETASIELEALQQ